MIGQNPISFLVAIAVGILLFWFSEPFGAANFRANAWNPFRFPKTAYPIAARVGGTFLILYGLGGLIYCGWVWVYWWLYR
jgi:hypothetical protein